MNPTTSCDSIEVHACHELSGENRDAMFVLLDGFFDGVVREQFESDLAEKNWVILLRRGERLVGFSTLLARETNFDGDPLLAIYSGDTIVAPEAWGTPALARAWIATVNRLRAGFSGMRCYWLLLTSGFRTYRFLPVFWREFFPRVNFSPPLASQHLLEHLAHEQYGERYDADSGVVRFQRPQKLRGSLSIVPSGREANADVAYFLARNPGHASGDELVCLTEISEANLTAAGRRIVAACER